MSHKIKVKQKVYGLGDDPMVGQDYCEPIADEKIGKPESTTEPISDYDE